MMAIFRVAIAHRANDRIPNLMLDTPLNLKMTYMKAVHNHYIPVSYRVVFYLPVLLFILYFLGTFLYCCAVVGKDWNNGKQKRRREVCFSNNYFSI